MSPRKTNHLSAGHLLRSQRQKRGWSLATVAQKAGIVKSTLSKWENGQVVPRAPELTGVLTVLEVPADERALLFQYWGLSAPHEGVPVLPVHGDLLRAMRHRALLSQSEAAHRAGITQGTLAKWEQGIHWPGAERLHALAFALGATAEEVAVLGTGVPTVFSSSGRKARTRTEADLSELEAEIRVLKLCSYVHPFLPYDLWFLSLLARLGPISLREDALGDRAFLLWAGSVYLYLVWLIQTYRRDTDALTRLFLERVRPRLGIRSDVHLWGFYLWVAQFEITAPIHRFLESPRNYLHARQGRFRVSSYHVGAIQALARQLATFAHSRPHLPTQLLFVLSDAEIAFLAALSHDSDAAEKYDIRVNRFLKTLTDGGADIATDRANMHYLLGHPDQALELMPTIPSPGVVEGEEMSMELVRRLERLRFRARALLDTGKSQSIEEGRYLLEVFHTELELLPYGSIRAGLGPIRL